MEINLETLHKFVRQVAQGPVTLVDSTGTTRTLKDGQPDVWELAKTANQFWYLKIQYDREAFAKLMEDEMKPANVFQIGLPELEKEV
jgi:hypothetical protein